MQTQKRQVVVGATAGRAAIDFKQSWRYRVGLTLIIVGHLTLGIAWLLPFFGISLGLAGFLMFCGEAMALLSIFFLGKEGFKAIKAKVFRAAKAGFTAPVGKVRHYIGIFLVSFNGLTAWTLLVLVLFIISRATPEAPTPEIWGLNWSQQNNLALFLLISGEVTFLLGIYVLGADWWERFRQLFLWRAAD